MSLVWLMVQIKQGAANAELRATIQELSPPSGAEWAGSDSLDGPCCTGSLRGVQGRTPMWCGISSKDANNVPHKAFFTKLFSPWKAGGLRREAGQPSSSTLSPLRFSPGMPGHSAEF